MSVKWDEILSDNGIMMSEGEAAKALALGISDKTALSGSTTSVDVSGMCSSLFAPIDWGFCDAVDQVISTIAPHFTVTGGTAAYSSSIPELITAAGFSTAVYGATNGEVRLRGGGVLFDSQWIEQRKGILHLLVNAGTPVSDAVFTVTSLDSNTWTVTGSSVSGATTTLPHSLNAIGSTATPTSYFRGLATYSTNITLDSSKRYYLYLEPVYQRADVVLGGHTASTVEVYGATSTQHVFTVERPGIPVVIDLTNIPFANGGNTLTVKTDSTSTFWNIPFNGLLDCYNILGGVKLCAAGKLCFDPMTYGTRRCHLDVTATKVTIKFAIKCNSNQSQAEIANVYINAYEGDDTTAMSNQVITEIEVNPGETKTYTVTFNLGVNLGTNKWGLGNGKLYRIKLELMKSGVVDTIEEYFGYRTFSVAKHTSNDNGYGFTLNGSTTSLYGVTYHHWDRLPTTDEMDADWDIIAALKPKMIRFAYFPALHYLLDKCDQAGIVAMLEIPWMYDFHNAEWADGNAESYRNAWRFRYQHNTTANAVAMINEFYNHPSVLFYSIGTGLGITNYHEYYETQAHTYITSELLPAVRAADSSRLVCIELASNTGSAWTDVSDVLMEHMNSGWGSGSISNAVSEADTWNGKNSTIPVGFLDWSYGANPAHHVEWSSASTKPSDTSINNDVEYPEEYQAYCVEQYAGSALALKWPVFNLYGAVFDYAAANVSAAGGKSGVMQTGLVTRDRSVLKDAYYYLKAMWNSEPMVYVTQKRNMEKEATPTTLRIYTNCNYVKVYSSSMTLLDTVQRTSGSYVVTKSVELEEGNNVFYVTGHSTSSGEATCNDSVVVNYEDTSGTTHIQIYSDSAIVNSGRVNAIVTPSTEPQGVTWSSDTPAVATINSGGTVTVIADGTASIRATSTNDNTITRTKTIPCFVRGATDSLYYQACTYADELTYTYRGLTVTNNKDGTTTFDGTLEWGVNNFKTWPFQNRALFPVWNIPGDQLLTCEIIGGTVTGTCSGDPITITPLDQAYTPLTQAALKPMNAINGSGDVNAKLLPNSTLGFSKFELSTTYATGAVFDNLTVRIQSYKQANEYYNAGLFEGHLHPINTVIVHPRSSDPDFSHEHQNMYSRNADGSHSELVANPNNGLSIPSRARVTDGFTVGINAAAVLSGSTIAVAGDVLKFTVVMKNWPPYYERKSTDDEWTFVVWYFDATEAATLCWAYLDDATGVDFTGGTASTTFIATKTVDCAGWKRAHFSLGGNLNCTNTITWQMKLEKLDPSQIPPNTITAYGSNRIVNTGYVNAIGDPVSANQNVTWSSSNTSVATIDSSTGLVTVVSDGSCTFTATSVLDSTKTGSVTVSCIKDAGTNLAANYIAQYVAQSSVPSTTVNGVTITGGTDGTVTLNGTLTTANDFGFNIPLSSNNSQNTYSMFFPEHGLSGDVVVWMEHLGGTVSEVSGYTGYDFGLRVYNESNTELTSYQLNYQEKPTASGDTQSILVTGSTEGVRRLCLRVKRPNGTVFDNYVLRLGLKKYSSQGNLYNGGLLSQYLPALCSFAVIGSKKTSVLRNPDGSFYIQWGTSTWVFDNKTSGCLKLTNGLAFYTGRTNIPNTDVIASSGTYKFKVSIPRACTFDSSSGSSSTELTFVVLGSDRTQLAVLKHIYQNAYTSDFDSNGEAEITFTSTMNITCVYLYYSSIKMTNDLVFGVKLETATT